MTTGTEGNDNLTNNRAINFETVDALGGDDVITIVTPSNDLTRVDVLGGAGNDTMRISALQFRSADGSGTAGTVLVREGSRNYTVTYNSVERLELTGGLFGPSVNFVTGASTDILRLSTTFQNAVTISTNEGDDEIYFQAQNPGSGGSVSIDAGAGNDLIDFTAVTGAGPTTFGNGGEGHDALVGSGFADRLLGGSGDDSLDGRAGTDTLEGGTGNDLYFVDTTGDAVIELPNEGEADEVRTALGSAVDYAALYVLPDNVEKLTGTSLAAQGVRGKRAEQRHRHGRRQRPYCSGRWRRRRCHRRRGNDFIYYGAAWSAADRTDGGEGTDTVGLLGSYDVTLTAETLTSVERLALYTASPLQAAPPTTTS
jgi:Ca2+-binding RTX toxin-like protein